MNLVAASPQPDGKTRYRCAACGASFVTADPPERIRCYCTAVSGQRRPESIIWPATEAEQLALLRQRVDTFYGSRPFADTSGAKERIAKCLRECQHFTAPRCSLAGNTCESRRRWFGWILAGECKRFDAR